MMKATAVLLLLAVASVRAQPSVGCNDKAKPGKPEELRFLSTYMANNAANAVMQWHRPRDAPATAPSPCISEYRIEVLADNKGRAHAGTVRVTDPKHTVMSYTATGLPPGKTYAYTITPIGPGGIGLTATSPSTFKAAAPAVTPVPL